jgi:hypothetical protein
MAGLGLGLGLGLARPDRCSTGKRDGRPASSAPWAVPAWIRGWRLQTSWEQEPAAVLHRAAYRWAAYRQVEFAPTPEWWRAATVRMTAVWRRAGSVRRAAEHPSAGDFVPPQSTSHSARPLSTQSRTAVVVSPNPSSMRNLSASPYRQKRAALSLFSDRPGSQQTAAGVPVAGIPPRRLCQRRT